MKTLYVMLLFLIFSHTCKAVTPPEICIFMDKCRQDLRAQVDLLSYAEKRGQSFYDDNKNLYSIASLKGISKIIKIKSEFDVLYLISSLNDADMKISYISIYKFVNKNLINIPLFFFV